MQIPVDLITGATLTLEVEPSDTVESVKAKIKAMSGITEDFGLAYDGKQMDEADGHRTLADYGIRDPATEMQILVSGLRGNTWTLWVEPSDTVESVKLQLQEKDGLPPCQQRLIFEGRQLDDGDTVASCGIREHSYLNLCGRLASCDCIRTHMEAQKLIQEHHQTLTTRPAATDEMQIFVRVLGGKKATALKVQPSDTVGSVKVKLYYRKKKKTMPCKQRLVFSGMELADDRTLASYGIEEESTLYLCVRLESCICSCRYLKS